MVAVQLAKLILGFLFTQWLVGRLARLVVWVVAVTAFLLAASALTTHAQELTSEVVLVHELAPPITACQYAGDEPRNRFFTGSQRLDLPNPIPAGVRYVLSGRPDSVGSLIADDQLVLLVTASDGHVRRLSLDFRDPDRRTILPAEPKDITSLLVGAVEARIELWDLTPPTCWAGPVFLIRVGPPVVMPAPPAPDQRSLQDLLLDQIGTWMDLLRAGGQLLLSGLAWLVGGLLVLGTVALVGSRFRAYLEARVERSARL